jgi:ubiquinone/menaquinone biosynthesis C-methylase UbiE
MNQSLDQRTEMWRLSAQTAANRMEAIHATIKGKPLPETIYDDILHHIDLLVNFQSDDIVLDIGTGSGLLLERVAPRVKNIAGTDIATEMLKWIPLKNNMVLSMMDSTNLGFSDNYFDKVMCYSVFQYFPDNTYAFKVFEEMVRVCKKGGVIFLGDIFNGYLREIYIKAHYKSLTLKEKVLLSLRGGYSTLNKMYLFLEPYELFNWCGKAGCHDFKAILQVSQQKPLLHRMFRYDAVIIK